MAGAVSQRGFWPVGRALPPGPGGGGLGRPRLPRCVLAQSPTGTLRLLLPGKNSVVTSVALALLGQGCPETNCSRKFLSPDISQTPKLRDWLSLLTLPMKKLLGEGGCAWAEGASLEHQSAMLPGSDGAGSQGPQTLTGVSYGLVQVVEWPCPGTNTPGCSLSTDAGRLCPDLGSLISAVGTGVQQAGLLVLSPWNSLPVNSPWNSRGRILGEQRQAELRIRHPGSHSVPWQEEESAALL